MKESATAQEGQRLIAEGDPLKFLKLKDKLIRTHAKKNPDGVVEALVRWIKQGKLKHLRGDVLLDVVNVVRKGDQKHAELFSWALTAPELAYWAVDGLLKTKGKGAYSELATLSRNSELPIDVRAKAIKSLAEASGQPFDRGLPTDPGHWKEGELRTREVEEWGAKGFPEGGGYNAPAQHPALKTPKTEIEKAAAKLEGKLKKARAEEQDLANPTNWLVIADPKDIAAIRHRWPLPATYLEFLEHFSPLGVLIEADSFSDGLHLHGASELIDAQDGYSQSPGSRKPIAGWPEKMVVIGDDAGDPYCIDCSAVHGGDAPVLFAQHGTGGWMFDPYADSFVDFLRSIAK